MNKITRATTPAIIGEQRPEAGIRLRPAPTAAELKAALAAASLDIPQRPEKPAKVAAGGRRGRARISLDGPLAEAFGALDWTPPTRPTLLAVPQLPEAAFHVPVPQQPAAWSQAAASLLLLAHGANGLLPSLAEGQTVTLSNFLIVAHDLRDRGAFAATKRSRSGSLAGDVGYLVAPDLFFRALGLAARRMVSVDYQADTIRLINTRD